jgi:hypothetical protein
MRCARASYKYTVKPACQARVEAKADVVVVVVEKERKRMRWNGNKLGMRDFGCTERGEFTYEGREG